MSTVHVIGAGLSGLAASVALAKRGRKVVLHEGARQAGGRCRSYYDSSLDMMIDNGNHLLLSGNTEALAYLGVLGSADQMKGPDKAEFPFVDLDSGEAWTVRPNAGRLPWWIFSERRRVPGTSGRDYLAPAKLMRAGRTQTIGELMTCEGRLYDRLWQPLLLAALNTDPPESSAALAGAIMKGTLGKGGAACRPLIAADGLGAAFVDPALGWLRANGADVRLDHPLRALAMTDDSITALTFPDATIEFAADDAVILAVPAPAAAALMPGLSVPKSFRSIVNAHFKMAPPEGLPPILGLVHGTVEWIFAFADRISITISGADRLLDIPREELIHTLWSDVCRAAKIDTPLPPWQIIREKRATFAATPAEDARRPGTRTRYRNLMLAGDWTATGLPATIEGSIQSGNRAASAIG